MPAFVSSQGSEHCLVLRKRVFFPFGWPGVEVEVEVEVVIMVLLVR